MSLAHHFHNLRHISVLSVFFLTQTGFACSPNFSGLDLDPFVVRARTIDAESRAIAEQFVAAGEAHGHRSPKQTAQLHKFGNQLLDLIRNEGFPIFEDLLTAIEADLPSPDGILFTARGRGAIKAFRKALPPDIRQLRFTTVKNDKLNALSRMSYGRAALSILEVLMWLKGFFEDHFVLKQLVRNLAKNHPDTLRSHDVQRHMAAIAAFGMHVIIANNVCKSCLSGKSASRTHDLIRWLYTQGHNVSHSHPGGFETTLFTPPLLANVLEELMNNAHEASKRRNTFDIAISPTVSLTPSGQAQLIIEDFGDPAEWQSPRHIGLTTQAHGTRSSGQGGFGIGLLKILLYTQFDHIDLKYEAKPDQSGTRVTLTFPVDNPAP